MAKSTGVISGVRTSGAPERFFDAAARVMERTLRILTGSSNLTVDVGTTTIFPAWTNLEKRAIYFKRFDLPRSSSGYDYPEATATIKGLLYHEVSHLLWTPAIKPVSASGRYFEPTDMSLERFFMIYNVMEDKRIENLFVRKYPPAAAYFARPVQMFILNEYEVMPNHRSAYFLLSGRYYLDGKLTATVRKLASDTGLDVTKLDELVNEYLTLSTRDIISNPRTVKRIINDVNSLLSNEKENLVTSTCSSGAGGEDGSSGAHNKHHEMTEASPRSSDQLSMDPDAKMSKEELEDLLSDQQADADASDSGPSKSGGEGEAGESQSTTSGDADGKAASKEDLRVLVRNLSQQQLEETIDKMMDDSKGTTKSIQSAARTGSGGTSALYEYKMTPVDSEMQSASARIQRDLNAIRNEGSPETLRNQIVGRLNQRRIVAQPDAFDPFDVFDIGTEDDMRIHVQLGIDLSDSMAGHNMQTASRASWILRDAFYRCDHDVDLYAYSSFFQLVDTRHNRSQFIDWKSNGGTSPLGMLKDMLYRTATRPDDDKLIIVVTDGLWFGDSAQYEQLMNEFRRLGGHSLMIVLGDPDSMIMKFDKRTSAEHPYGFDTASYGLDMMATIPAIEGYVKQLMKSHLTR